MIAGCFVASVIALAAFPVYAQADEAAVPRIAVLELVAKKAPEADASIISDFLRTALVTRGDFTVLERSNIDKVLSEQAFQATGCTNEKDAVKLGKLLNVEFVVMGTYAEFAGRYHVSADLVDVETGKIVRSESIAARSSDSLLVRIGLLAKRLAGKRDAGDLEYEEMPTRKAGDKLGPRLVKVSPKRFSLTGSKGGRIKFEGLPKKARVRIYTLDGRKEWTSKSARRGKVEFKVHGVKPGWYLWVAAGKGWAERGKFLVEK
jgi:TolB-like protein